MIYFTSLQVSLSNYLSSSQWYGVWGLWVRVVSLDISKRIGLIWDSMLSSEGVAGEECQVFEGPEFWPAQDMNSPVAQVLSMRLPILLNRGNPFLWKSFTLLWLWKGERGGGEWEGQVRPAYIWVRHTLRYSSHTAGSTCFIALSQPNPNRFWSSLTISNSFLSCRLSDMHMHGCNIDVQYLFPLAFENTDGFGCTTRLFLTTG